AQHSNQSFWVAAERARTFLQLFSAAQFDEPLPEIESASFSHDEAILAMVTGWMGHAGPITSAQLANVLAVSPGEVDNVLLRLETSGVILRDKFTSASAEQTEWFERRLLARIHRLTLRTLRKQIESATPAQFMS